jgi:N-acetyltransferase 10
LTEEIKVKDVKNLPPLLSKLSEIPLDHLPDWIGVSYGLTSKLFKFWKRLGYTPVYIRQTRNDLTGEHTCMMIQQFPSTVTTKPWLDLFSVDFRNRFINLLAYTFKSLPISLMLSILAASSPTPQVLQISDVERMFSMYDLKRIESYASNLLDYHVLMDLVPSLATIVLKGYVDMRVSQSGIVFGIGCQKKTVEEVSNELGIEVAQVLAVFAKAVRKISLVLNEVVEGQVKEMVEEMVVTKKGLGKDLENESEWRPTELSLEEDLSKSGNEVLKALREKQKEMVDELDLKSYDYI